MTFHDFMTYSVPDSSSWSLTEINFLFGNESLKYLFVLEKSLKKKIEVWKNPTQQNDFVFICFTWQMCESCLPVHS